MLCTGFAGSQLTIFELYFWFALDATAAPILPHGQPQPRFRHIEESVRPAVL